MSYVVGFGGAAVDMHLKCRQKALLHDSNPACAFSSPGGVMRNILENLGRLQHKTVLLSAVGKDSFADIIADSCRRARVDAARLYTDPGCSTALYFSFLDSDGDMLIAANAMEIFGRIPESYLASNEKLLQGAAAAILDTNPAAERMEQFVRLCGQVPIFADPVSVAKSEKLRPLLPKLHLIKPNLYELQSLTGVNCSCESDIEKAAAKLLETGCYSVAVSLGDKGCYYANREGVHFFASLSPAEAVNATGGGDAFMAGLVSGCLDGLSPEAMVARALACGKLAVQSSETICPGMSREAVTRLLETEHKL